MNHTVLIPFKKKKEEFVQCFKTEKLVKMAVSLVSNTLSPKQTPGMPGNICLNGLQSFSYVYGLDVNLLHFSETSPSFYILQTFG